MRGQLVGEEGRGVQTIIRMVNHTRLDCLIGSSAGMRWGLAQAVHHARHRSAFGKLLADQPLMRNVLADLAIESEAATAVTMRVARAYDEGDAPFRRIATAVMKHCVCKRAPGHAGEALECLGGNGYVEESGMPRLLRDSPLNSIWEGSGNVSALDVLRALAKEPEALPAFLAECELGRGGNAALDAHLDRDRATRGRRTPSSRRAGWSSDLAVALQASLLVRHAPAAVADAFCAARLDGGRPRLRHAARRASTPRRSWTARSPLEHAPLRGHRPGRADHARPARAGNGITLDDAARAGGVRGGGEPRPRRARDRARRQRQGLLRRLRPGGVRRDARRRTTTRASPGTRSWTGR